MLDASTIGLAASAITAGALGLVIGGRLVSPLIATRRDLSGINHPGISDYAGIGELKEARGKLRSSSIIGMYGGDLRHDDGSYSRLYRVTLESSMLAHEQTIEHRYDQLARMLAIKKPPGTVISFRLSSDADPGDAIGRLLAARGDGRDTNSGARGLQDKGLSFIAGQAAAKAFRRTDALVFIRVPAKQRGDDKSGGFSSFFPTLFREIKSDGIRNVARAVIRASAESSLDSIVRRLEEDEAEAHLNAIKIFRSIERDCPLKLDRLSPQETFSAVYFSHNQNANDAPSLTENMMLDLRPYLCGETIESHGSFLLHGMYPVAMVSMFTPPQPEIHATSMRYLLANPQLTCRHTLITEYVYMKREEAKTKLDKRIKGIVRASLNSGGIVKMTPEAHRAHGELVTVRDQLTSPVEAMVKCRVYALVYGDPARTKGELRRSVERLDEDCEQLLSTMRLIPGADAQREEPRALRRLYQKAMLGEASAEDTGREVEEMADSLCCLTPTERAWPGVSKPHSLISTTTGRLTAINLFDTNITSSPVVVVLGAMGSGKTVWIANTINDILATMPKAKVHMLDFGENFGPLCDVVGGRHIRFVVGETRALNIWAYAGLENGEPPDDVQIQLVVGDIMTLARVREDDELAEKVIKTIVKEVYNNEVAYNQPGFNYHEPTLSHFLNVLKNYPFDKGPIKDRANLLKLSLEDYRGHPWLDAETHEDYKTAAQANVYEMDSLRGFEQDVKASMAYRVGAHMTRAIGELQEDGTRTPTALVFDEMWKVRDEFPQMLYALRKGVRQGRRDRVVTFLATHSYEDLEAVQGIVKNAGVKIIGLQIGEFDTLARDTELSAAACNAVRAIHNIEGVCAQFVMSIGTGSKQVVEMVQVDVSPIQLWTYTSQGLERDARNLLRHLRPGWTELERLTWLAQHYPRGLAHAGLSTFDTSLLNSDANSNVADHSASPVDNLFDIFEVVEEVAASSPLERVITD